jgi:hypothetical protein
MIGEEGGVLSDQGAHEPKKVHDAEDSDETDVFGFRKKKPA